MNGAPSSVAGPASGTTASTSGLPNPAPQQPALAGINGMGMHDMAPEMHSQDMHAPHEMNPIGHQQDPYRMYERPMRWGGGADAMARGQMLSETNLYVEGVPSEWSDQQLRAHFQRFGDITAARILVDKQTNVSREVGFVHFATHDQAMAAMTAVSGQKAYEGAPRTFKIKFANRGRKQEKPRPPPPPPGPRYDEPCRYYARGRCKRGDACFYRHVAPVSDYPSAQGGYDYNSYARGPPRYDTPGAYPYQPPGEYPPPHAPYNGYPTAYSQPPTNGYSHGYGPAPRDPMQSRWSPYGDPRGQPSTGQRYDYTQPATANAYAGYYGDPTAAASGLAQPATQRPVQQASEWAAQPTGATATTASVAQSTPAVQS